MLDTVAVCAAESLLGPASEALVEGCGVDHRPIGVLGGFSCLLIRDIIVLPHDVVRVLSTGFEYHIEVSAHVGYTFSS